MTKDRGRHKRVEWKRPGLGSRSPGRPNPDRILPPTNPKAPPSKPEDDIWMPAEPSDDGSPPTAD
jgi:hypothetical protein